MSEFGLIAREPIDVGAGSTHHNYLSVGGRPGIEICFHHEGGQDSTESDTDYEAAIPSQGEYVTVSRNVVLVSVDSIRADHCGFMGYDRATTPHLDALADEGITYTTAIAPGQATPASMPAIFTGQYHANPENKSGLAQRDAINTHLSAHPTIPERFTRAGYDTAGFTPNPYTSRHFGFARDFDHFEDFLDRSTLAGQIRKRIVSRWIEGKFVAGLRFGLNMLGWGDISTTWESYYDQLQSQVASLSEPFFLWVFLLEPHWPYRPSRGNRYGRSTTDVYAQNWKRSPFSDATPMAEDVPLLEDLYDGTLRDADRFIGRIREDLREYDPVVVVHGDHGEAIGERGYFGHGSLHEEVIHVPLVVGNVDDDERIDRPISLRALPRLVEAASRDGPTDWASFTEPYVWSKTRKSALAVRSPSWKFYRRNGDDSFYDLDADPEELSPLAPDSTAIGSLLVDLVTRYETGLVEADRIAQAAAEAFE
jgi:arylsulfatase